MMRFVTRLCLVLGAAVLIHFCPDAIHAGDEPRYPADGSMLPAQAAQAPPSHETATFTVCVPQPSNSFEVSASLLYLQPGAGNLMYGTLVNPFPFLSPHWADQTVRPDFTPAFNVGIRYVLDGGADIALDWTHLNTYDGADVIVAAPLMLQQLSGPSSIQALGPPFLIGPPVPYAAANAVAHFAYDAINLQGELPLSFGNHVKLQTFAGIQGTHIGESLSANFRSADGTLAFADVSKSSFAGVGPRLGMELHCSAGDFEILGGIAAATLIGMRQSHMDFFASTPSNTAAGLTPNVQFLTSPNSTQVIPCIDGRLAAGYSIALGKFGVLRCETGYQAAVYINAINQYALSEVENNLTADKPATPETTGSTVFLRTAAETQTNFLAHGPYLKISLQF